MRSYLCVAVVVVLGAATWWFMQPTGELRPIGNTAMHDAGSDTPAPQALRIVVPSLSMDAKRGKLAFEENCVACHGANGAGTGNGSPLIHEIYEPSHHCDASFYLAARNGVRAHHWRFRDMPPVEGVSDQEVEYIVAYVREVQRANGIQ